MDWDKMSNLYRGPSIDASYEVSIHLAEGFQRRRLKCEKLTYDGRQVMAKAHKMAPTCEKNVRIKLTPKNFLLIIFNVVYIEVNETRKKL